MTSLRLSRQDQSHKSDKIPHQCIFKKLTINTGKKNTTIVTREQTLFTFDQSSFYFDELRFVTTNHRWRSLLTRQVNSPKRMLEVLINHESLKQRRSLFKENKYRDHLRILILTFQRSD